MDKNILIIGFNSELAQNTIKELKQNNWNIYATSRQVGMMEDKVHEYNLDVTNEMNFIHLKEKFSDLKFDVILNFAGIAIAVDSRRSASSFLDHDRSVYTAAQS